MCGGGASVEGATKQSEGGREGGRRTQSIRPPPIHPGLGNGDTYSNYPSLHCGEKLFFPAHRQSLMEIGEARRVHSRRWRRRGKRPNE